MSKETNAAVEEEFKASHGVNASIPDPIDVGSNKRPADKDQGDKKPMMPKSKMISSMMEKAYKMSREELNGKYGEFMKGSEGVPSDASKKNMASVSVKEDVEEMFNGSDLSEEFKDKASTLFEAAVHAKVVAETARLEEEFEAKVEEEVASLTAALEEQVDAYLSYVAEQWLEENKLAVESGIRTEVLESFMSGLKNLFTEHYIDVPEDKVDVVESMATKIEELEGKLNEQINTNLEIQKQLDEAKAADIFAEVTEGLSDTQVEKLRTLAEGISYETLDEYKSKLETVVESYSAAPKRNGKAEEQLNEEVEIESEKNESLDPGISRYVDAISRTIKR